VESHVKHAAEKQVIHNELCALWVLIERFRVSSPIENGVVSHKSAQYLQEGPLPNSCVPNAIFRMQMASRLLPFYFQKVVRDDRDDEEEWGAWADYELILNMIFVFIINIVVSIDFAADYGAANANYGEHESDELGNFELAVSEVALSDIFKSFLISWLTKVYRQLSLLDG